MLKFLLQHAMALDEDRDLVNKSTASPTGALNSLEAHYLVEDIEMIAHEALESMFRDVVA